MDLDRVKADLIALQDSILQRRSKIAGHIDNRDEPLPADFSEQAVELENDEVMVGLSGELDVMLKDVNDALQRLNDGTYGTCTQCGKQVQSDRLAALPSTRFCIRCAGAID